MAKVKRQLEKVQKRMKKYHAQGRHVVTFQMGEYIYLKLQPTRQKSMHPNPGAKLNQKFGSVAYMLQLPPTTSLLHPMFHVSLLKRKMGDPSQIEKEIPTIN